MLVSNLGEVLRLPVRFHPGKPHSGHEYAFLERRFTPRTIFMEIGGADCDLALRAAGYVERVYAIDVFGRLLQSVAGPPNLRLVLCDGVRIPVPAASVDVAWGGAFMDQLHSDDADEHLKSVRRALVPGGEYVCRTGGSPREVAQRMIAAGFLRVRYYAGNLRVPGFSVLPSSLVRIAAIK
jgi:SAM-dependent methyltransferase